MIRTTAYGKLNLHLHVKDKRPDGFHDIESVFLPIAFGDELTFELAGKGIDVTVDWNGSYELIPIEENLVFKAVKLFREQTGWDEGIRIHVEKRIPIGAGLGGGSSDTAAVLRMLNVITGVGLPLTVLTDIAAILGSDVPFFLRGTPAFVSGRGERISPIHPRRELFASVIYPGFGSGTREAFRRLDARRESVGTKTQPVLEGEKELVKMFEKPLLEWRFVNDFLPVLLDGEYTDAYRTMLTLLEAADFYGLSGSGSCCFGIWEKRSDMENFAKWDSVEKTIKNLEKNAKIVNTFILPLAI
ncbi:MAG: 4-(cytidine 5'-diphospho)-2-C-methyl-D-erythritol kinase [Treponema sp.]|jgi:4-diphosphocytidyl-2-C-methyl-D-erythritol kinase|nr:4-(cytidine 5'-diphospho)-2-C-methyl-D-erythritol kinase [Treponema sp.]